MKFVSCVGGIVQHVLGYLLGLSSDDLTWKWFNAGLFKRRFEVATRYLFWVVQCFLVQNHPKKWNDLTMWQPSWCITTIPAFGCFIKVMSVMSPVMCLFHVQQAHLIMHSAFDRQQGICNLTAQLMAGWMVSAKTKSGSGEWSFEEDVVYPSSQNHGSGKWMRLKGSYCRRDPFFTSMIIWERVACVCLFDVFYGFYYTKSPVLKPFGRKYVLFFQKHTHTHTHTLSKSK